MPNIHAQDKSTFRRANMSINILAIWMGLIMFPTQLFFNSFIFQIFNDSLIFLFYVFTACISALLQRQFPKNVAFENCIEWRF